MVNDPKGGSGSHLKRHAPVGAPLRMKKDKIEVATFRRKDDQQYTVKLLTGHLTKKVTVLTRFVKSTRLYSGAGERLKALIS